MKRLSILIFLSAALVLPFYGAQKTETTETHDTLKTIIAAKQWARLPALFLDDSFQVLETYFSPCRSIKFTPAAQPDRINYKAKFTGQGEVGVISFEKQGKQYRHLKIRNQIRPLYFIEGFRKYRAAGTRLNLGDAVIQFKEGYFYEPLPFKFLLLFEGKWEFSIRPNSEEERLTLERRFKKDHFTKSRDRGVFILDDKEFLSRLTPAGETTDPGKDVRALFRLYNQKYGIPIPQFDEYWYLPFSQGAGVVLFEKDRRSLYIYSYNPDTTPDTQLVTSDDSTILLNYNHYRGLKLHFGGSESVDKIRLNLFYNPRSHFASGTVTISYAAPSTLHTLKLAESLKLTGNLDTQLKDLNVFRKKVNYHLLGSETDTLSLLYNGSIADTPENMELFKQRDVQLDESRADHFFFLSRNQHFYPNPGEYFFQTDVVLNLPAGMNGLAVGSLVEKSFKGRNLFRYRSRGAKGISFICGEFKRMERLEGIVPLNLYSAPSFNYADFLDVTEIKEGADCFVNAFGSPHVSEFNVLVKRGAREGGVSNTGFVVVNINPQRKWHKLRTDHTSTVIRSNILSPVLLRDAAEDHVLHELAHQWWGGVISWKSYRDVWLTEGLAHFSVLYFLRGRLTTRKYNRILKKLKYWIHKYAKTGPIIYGTRINQLEEDYEAYQAVVYDKGAFVFLMLLDVLGEQEFLLRLRGVLEKYTHKNISSRQFIRSFSGDNQMLKKFFDRWVFSRKIPRVRVTTQVHVKKEKQFKITVRQLNGDFVFPLTVRVVTRKGSDTQTLVVSEKEQSFIISRKSPIKSVKPIDPSTLVQIE